VAKLRLGIIGTGSIANAHAGGYKKHLDQVELVAACDIREDVAQAFAQRHGFQQVFTDYRTLLEQDIVDCVSVCTPNNLHAPISIEALRQGKSVLCEKPMSTSVALAEQMKQASEETGKVLYIGFNHRLIGNFNRGKQLLDQRLGRVLAARVAVGHGAYAELQRKWFAHRDQSGGGTFIDNGVHMIDMIRWYIGPIEEVTGQTSRMMITEGDVEDNGYALFRCRGGATASLQCSWTWWGGYTLVFDAICENGTLSLSGSDCVAYDKEMDARIEAKVPNLDCWAEEVKHFLAAARGDEAPFITPEDGLAAVRAAVGAYQSEATGQVVKLDQL
jgi:predicted dehydrogenase